MRRITPRQASLVAIALISACALFYCQLTKPSVTLSVVGFTTNTIAGDGELFQMVEGRLQPVDQVKLICAIMCMTNSGPRAVTVLGTTVGGPDPNYFFTFGPYPFVHERTLLPGEGVTFQVALDTNKPCRIKIPCKGSVFRERLAQIIPAWLVKLDSTITVTSPEIDVNKK